MTALATVLFVAALAGAVYVAFSSRRSQLRFRAEEQRLQQQRRVAAALLGIARRFVLASRESLGSLRGAIDEELRRYFAGVESVAVFDLAEPDELTCVFASGRRLEDYLGSAIPLVSSMLPAIAARELATVALAGRAGAQPLSPGDVDAIAVPLAIEPGATSVVYVAGAPPGRGGWDVVDAVCQQAAPSYWIAVERDDMLRRLTFDPMTSLYNRAAFELRLGEAIARGDEVACVYLDLDGFKGWNDAYGHKSGDNVLEQVGGLMRDHLLSPRDLPARLGGDEFAIAFVGSPKSRAIERALQLGAAIFHADRSEIVAGDDRGLAIRASLGVAQAPDEVRLALQLDDETLRQMRTDRKQLQTATEAQRLIILADALMYHAKASGKDRVAYYLENGERNVSVCSDFDRRDPISRPDADRRADSRAFAGGARVFAPVGSGDQS